MSQDIERHHCVRQFGLEEDFVMAIGARLTGPAFAYAFRLAAGGAEAD